jgi:hypothetical protein
VWAAELAKPLFDHRRIRQNPAIDCAMIDLEATFPEHLFQIPIAEWIVQIPGHRLHDQPRLELPAFAIILRLALQFFGNGIQNHRLAPQRSERQFSSDDQYTVNLENLRQGRETSSTGNRLAAMLLGAGYSRFD